MSSESPAPPKALQRGSLFDLLSSYYRAFHPSRCLNLKKRRSRSTQTQISLSVTYAAPQNRFSSSAQNSRRLDATSCTCANSVSSCHHTNLKALVRSWKHLPWQSRTSSFSTSTRSMSWRTRRVLIETLANRPQTLQARSELPGPKNMSAFLRSRSSWPLFSLRFRQLQASASRQSSLKILSGNRR